MPDVCVVCVECGATSDDGRDWKTYLAADGEAATYCPECAAREFGGDDA